MNLTDDQEKPRSFHHAIAAARLACPRPAMTEETTMARIAAVQAARDINRLLPLRHPVTLEFVGVTFSQTDGKIDIQVEVKALGRSSVEAEALLGAGAAAVALHNSFGGGLDPVIEALLLLDTSTVKMEIPRQIRAGVLVLSDSVSDGKKLDRSGNVIRERLIETGVSISKYLTIPDDAKGIERTIIDWCENEKLNLIVTTGGTGLGPRDNTPEVLDQLIERRLPGVEEAMRAYGQERTPFAMLSRSVAGARGHTMIVALPGSPRAVGECLDVLLPTILHTIPILEAGGH